MQTTISMLGVIHESLWFKYRMSEAEFLKRSCQQRMAHTCQARCVPTHGIYMAYMSGEVCTYPWYIHGIHVTWGVYLHMTYMSCEVCTYVWVYLSFMPLRPRPQIALVSQYVDAWRWCKTTSKLNKTKCQPLNLRYLGTYLLDLYLSLC